MKSPLKIIYPDHIIRFGLVIFAAFSPFSIAGAQLGLGIGLVGWLLKIICKRRLNWTSSYLEKPFLLYIVALLVCAFFAYNKLNSFKAVGEEWLILIFFLMISNIKDMKFIKRILLIIILISSLVAVYAIIQHYTGIDLYRSRTLGVVRGTHKYRSIGNFSVSLTYGFYAMLISILSFCLALYEKSKLGKYFFYCATILCATASLFTYSRSTLLALFVAASFFFIFNWNKRKLLIPVLAYFLLIYAVDPQILLRSERAIQAESIVKADSRAIIWTTSLGIFLDHPIFGVGFNNFAGLYESYRPQGAPVFGHAHNDFLNTAANAGIVGLVAFIWLMFSILKGLVKIFRGAKGDLATSISNAVLLSFVAYLAASQFQCYYIDAVDGLILFFVLGVGQTVDNHYRGNSVDSRLRNST